MRNLYINHKQNLSIFWQLVLSTSCAVKGTVFSWCLDSWEHPCCHWLKVLPALYSIRQEASNGHLVGSRRRKQENSDTSEYFFWIHGPSTKGNAYVFIHFQTIFWEFSVFSFWQTFPAASWTCVIFLCTVTSFRQLCSLAAPCVRKYLCFELAALNSFLVWLHIL